MPDIYNNAIKKESPESLPVIILYWDYDICEKFLQKLNVNHTESQSIKKSTRKQRESKDGKNRLTSTSAHKIFIRKKNFDTLYKQLDKPFNEQTESVKQALLHGIRNETLAIEKNQFIMSYKLKIPVEIREAGTIIQSQLFWLGASPDGVIFDQKKFKKLAY